MISVKNMFVLPIFVALVSNNAFGGTWDVIQDAQVTDEEYENLQEDSQNSVQVLNDINLIASNGDVTTTLQTANIDENDITFEQEDGTSNSVQAINRLRANNITVSANQETTAIDDLDFDQNRGVGNSNIQTVNLLEVSNTANAITQVATGLDDVDFTQRRGSDNTQAVNLAIAPVLTGISNSQTVDMDGEVEFSQEDGNQNIQALNLLETNGNISQLTQSVNTDEFDFRQEDTIDSLQAANAVLISVGGGSSIAASITQSFAANSVTMDQDGSESSKQIINYVGVGLTTIAD